MNILTAKALDSLVKEVLPKLLAELTTLSNTPPDNRICNDNNRYLIKEGVELLSLLTNWAQIPTPSLQKEDMNDDEAKMLLQEMDAPVTKNTTTEIDDDEAKMLLQEMDAPVTKNTTTEIDDDEAKMLLQEMDAPVAKSANTEIDDEEARKLLEAMDAPASAPAQMEPIKTEAPSDPDQTPPDGEEAIDPNEEIEEIEEFGESEFGSDPEMIKDFITNSDELLEILDDQILELEQDPENTQTIEEIFRAAHTLKGAAGMFAFHAIERVMHRTENYFDQVRKGKTKANSDSIDVILKSMDVLHELVSGVKEGKPSGVKTAPIVKTLNQLCAGTYTASQQSTNQSSEKDNPEANQIKKSKDDNTVKKAPKSKKIEQSTIRVDLQRLDALVNLVGELVIDRTRFSSIEEQLRMIGSNSNLASNMTETVQLFGRHMNEIQDIIMKIRMVPIGNAFNKFPRVIRDLSKSLQKDIELIIQGETTELDKTLVEQIGDPLVHLIRNAVDHGIEMPLDREKSGKNPKGKITLSARQEGNQIQISIEDDGKGMSKDIIRSKGIEKGLIKEEDNLDDRDIFGLIFEPGFSTAEKVTNISGRGVGMDVVKKQISKLKGIIDINSIPQKGTSLSIQLPLTLAIVQSLLVQSDQEIFAIPLSSVIESIRISPSEIQKVGDSDVIKRRNMVLPLLYLKKALNLKKSLNHRWYDNPENNQYQNKSNKKNDERFYVVVVGNAERRFGIVVDNLLNQQEMVIKSMGQVMQDLPCVAGGSILGNGEVVLVLDIAELEQQFRNKSRQLNAA